MSGKDLKSGLATQLAGLLPPASPSSKECVILVTLYLNQLHNSNANEKKEVISISSEDAARLQEESTPGFFVFQVNLCHSKCSVVVTRANVSPWL